MSTLLIGNGLIGSYIVKHFMNKNKKIVVIDKSISKDKVIDLDPNIISISTNLENHEQVKEIYEKYSISEVIISAGSLGKNFDLNTENSLNSEAKLLLSITIASQLYKIKRLLYVSSFAVYGNDNKLMEESSETNPKTTYGIIKLYNEKLISYLSMVGSEIIIIRPVGVIGPVDEYSGNWMSTLLKYTYFNRDNDFLDNFKHANEIIDARDLASFIFNIMNEKIEENPVVINVSKNNEENANELMRALNILWKIKKIEFKDLSYPRILNRKAIRYGLKINYNTLDSVNYIGDQYEKNK